jgi:hypothetical protein
MDIIKYQKRNKVSISTTWISYKNMLCKKQTQKHAHSVTYINLSSLKKEKKEKKNTS